MKSKKQIKATCQTCQVIYNPDTQPMLCPHTNWIATKNHKKVE